ncbi:MAG: ABC transporter permease [Acidimicrobiales bacterium]|nr:ABC transporter permease [Acidimicrobiales bacterium]
MNAGTRITAALAIVFLGFFLVVAAAGTIRGNSTGLDADPLEAPSAAHPFGTDALGRDLLSRTGEGAMTSAFISLLAVGIAVAVAMPIGIAAGWRSGSWFDVVVMRIVETTQVVPPLILVLLLLGAAGPGSDALGPFEPSAPARIAICLGIAFIPFFARIVRSATMAQRQEPYLGELQRLGVKRFELATGELLPNLAPVVATQALLALAIVVFAEGGLSFLGLGIAPPTPTLGGLVAEAGTQLLSNAWWYAFIPGFVLVAGITGLNFASAATATALSSRSHRTTQ